MSRSIRRLATRHLDRTTLLAAVVGDSPEQSADLARRGFAQARRSGRPLDEALVTAFGRLASGLPAADLALGRLLVLLVDVEQQPAADVAATLGLDPPKAHLLLTAARRVAFSQQLASACRGWGLASGRISLSPAEQRAGVAHLSLCRRCRDRRAAADQAQEDLVARTAAVAGLVVAGQLVAAAVPATTVGVGGLLFGKVSIGLVGALGAAVLAGGGVAAVARHTSGDSGGTPRPSPTTQSPGPVLPAPHGQGQPTAPGATTAPCARSCVSPTPTSLPLLDKAPSPAVLPSQVGAVLSSIPGVPPLPVPLPTVTLPTGLLPTVPPVPVPTSLRSLLP